MTGPMTTRHVTAFPVLIAHAPTDPALALAREIEAAEKENIRLLDLANDAWELLPEWALGFPKIPQDHPAFANVPKPANGEPWHQSREEWETYFERIERAGPASVREAAKRQNAERLALYDAEQARIEAEYARVGYAAAQAVSDAMGERITHLEKRLATTAATTLQGIIAKLKVAIKYASLSDIEDRLTLSAITDAEQLAGAAA